MFNLWVGGFELGLALAFFHRSDWGWMLIALSLSIFFTLKGRESCS